MAGACVLELYRGPDWGCSTGPDFSQGEGREDTRKTEVSN